MSRTPLSEREEKAKMLIATDYAQKMSLSICLIDPAKYGDHMDNKAFHVAEMVVEYYKKFELHKATQFIFSDLETYEPSEWRPCSEIKRKLVDDYGIPFTKYALFRKSKRIRHKTMIKYMNEDPWVVWLYRNAGSQCKRLATMCGQSSFERTVAAFEFGTTRWQGHS